jgi:Na+-driven multidrug efflux pump
VNLCGRLSVTNTKDQVDNVWIVSLQIGFVFGLLIAVLLGATMPAFSKVFSTDADVLNIIKGLIPVCEDFTFLFNLCMG